MKKRLLSAALALAMVLTMLPLSVFAASTPPSPPPEGTNVSYQSTNLEATDKNSGHGIGWYYSVTANGRTDWYPVTTGIITGTGNSGTWYNSPVYNTGTVGKPNWIIRDSFTLLGDITVTHYVTRNFTADLNGHTLTILNGSDAWMSDAVTSITLNDRQYNGSNTRGELAMDIKRDEAASTARLTVTATNVKINSIQLTNSATHTVNLTNCEVGAITLSGKDDNSQSQSLTVKKGTTGNIAVSGNSSTITLEDLTTGTGAGATAPTVNLTGLSTRLTVNGSSEVGAVTLLGSETAKTGTAPTVTINSGTVASIAQVSKEALTSNYNVTIGAANVGGATVTDEITLGNANLTINRSKTDSITVKNGAVKIVGNNADVGQVALADATNGGTVSLSVTGSHNKVGDITGAKGTFTLSIPADNTNSFSKVELKDYTGHGVLGGTWTTAPDANHLSTTLRYKLTKATGGTKITFYTSAQLGDALTAQGGDTNNNSIAIVGQENAGQTVTFKNGDKTYGVVSTLPHTSITLPKEVNGVKVDNWTDGTYTMAAGSNYSTPTGDDATVTLNAQTSTTSVTKLTGVSAVNNADDIRAELRGNVITLSGSVSKASGTVDVTLVTDLLQADGYLKERITIVYDTAANTITFANPGADGLEAGMTLEQNFTVLRLSNGTTYTLNGSGLRAKASGITIEYAIQSGYSGKIVATINVSGFTDGQKEALKKEIEGSVATSGPFTWSNSPAMKQAVNAALATITTSQVDSWRTQAQRAAWQAKNSGTPTAAQLANTGFKDVVLIPYLAVNVTAYNANGTMTATMVPSYRVVVKAPGTGTYTGVFKNKNTGDADGNYIVKTGTSLGTLGGEFGKVEVAFNFATNSPFDSAYMHQDSTYVYEGSNKAFTINHAGRTGLGSVVLNTTAPLVSMRRAVGAKGPDGSAVENNPVTYYYDSLQAAVDDTLPQEAGKEDTIIVTAAYTGSGTINVTGLARKFKINTVGNTTISSSASGGLVDVTGSGHNYTIQLLKDNASATSTVSISVNTATGGSATVSSGSAKPGDTVTVTPRAVSGYKVSGVTAVTNTGASVPVKANSNGTYTFTVPANATKVTVTPRFVASENRIFPDVDPKSWYGPSVKYCYETTVRGVRLMEGDANGNFAPNAKLTRAQMVQMLYNLAGRPTVTGACPFPDVVGTGYDWAAAPITWAAQKGYVIGYSDGKFHPEVNVSRQDMVLILYRYAKQPAIGASGSLSGYYDASSVGSWAYDAVRWAASMGILSGTNSVALNGYINGPVRANRCEVAVTLANFHRLYG